MNADEITVRRSPNPEGAPFGLDCRRDEVERDLLVLGVNAKRVRSMSALGHKQTLRREFAMSALPPKADVDPQLFKGS